MSDDQEDVDDVDQEAAAGDGDQPEMDDDEIADVDLDALADEVEAEAGADQPDTDETASDDETEQADADADADDDLAPEGDSWGDMYVGTLTTVSNAIIEEHGKPGAEHVDEDLAKQLHLDEYFDEWMATKGKSDMPPEQALLVSTTMFLVVVVGTKTDVASKLMEEVDF